MDERRFENMKLEKQLCFPLYACARETIKLYTPKLERIGLTYTQYITMMVLWENISMTAKDLGTTLHLDSGTLTPLLKKLEGKGLVSRQRSSKDERNLIVTVTEEGVALREKAVGIPEEMASCLDLNLEEFTTLYRLLYRMLDSMER